MSQALASGELQPETSGHPNTGLVIGPDIGRNPTLTAPLRFLNVLVGEAGTQAWIWTPTIHPILVGLTESHDQRKGWIAQRSAVDL